MVKIVKKRVNSNLGRLRRFNQKNRLFSKVRLFAATRQVSLRLSGAGPGGMLAMKNADGGLSERSGGAALRLHPWPWMLLALLLTAVSFVWSRITEPDEIPLDIAQLPVLIAGIVAAGASVWMRCADPQAGGIDALPAVQRGLASLAIAVVHAGLAVAVTVQVVMKCLAPVSVFGGGQTMVWPVILWLLVVPWCCYSAWRLLTTFKDPTKGSSSRDGRFETAVLITQAGLAAFLASWALYWGPQSSDSWDSIRLFLGVLAAVAFLAAPLVAASSTVRRMAVSALVLAHFAAILTAVLGSTPGPWIMAQAEHCIFRPYLDFMYLNNAYRFYSPNTRAGLAAMVPHRISPGQGGAHTLGQAPRYRRRGSQRLPNAFASHPASGADREH